MENTKQLNTRLIDLLKQSVTLQVLKLPSMSDAEYDELAEIIKQMGGQWSERYQGFLFRKDPDEQIAKIMESGVYTQRSDYEIWKENIQYYPTPKVLAEKIIKIAAIKDGDVILEPSAGQGAILDCLPKQNKKIVVEIDDNNIKVLQKKGYNVITKDFLNLENLEYNKVVMNPPFSRNQDCIHIMKAYDGLKVGGTLVSIANENILFRNNAICNQFKTFLLKTRATIENVPEYMFEKSGTMINTIIVTIKKDA